MVCPSCSACPPLQSKEPSHLQPQVCTACPRGPSPPISLPPISSTADHLLLQVSGLPRAEEQIEEKGGGRVAGKARGPMGLPGRPSTRDLNTQTTDQPSGGEHAALGPNHTPCPLGRHGPFSFRLTLFGRTPEANKHGQENASGDEGRRESSENIPLVGDLLRMIGFCQ